MQCREKKLRCYEDALVIIRSLVYKENYFQAYRVAFELLKLHIYNDIISLEEKTELCRICVYLYDKNDKIIFSVREKLYVLAASVVVAMDEKTDESFARSAELSLGIFTEHTRYMLEHLKTAEILLAFSLRVFSSLALKTKNADYMAKTMTTADILAIIYGCGKKTDRMISLDFSALKCLSSYRFRFFKSDMKRGGKKAARLAQVCADNNHEKEALRFYEYALELTAGQIRKHGDGYKELADMCGKTAAYFEKTGDLNKTTELYKWQVCFNENSGIR